MIALAIGCTFVEQEVIPMAKTGRGPAGSVRGVPENDASEIIGNVVARLAEHGLEFDRSLAAEMFESEIERYRPRAKKKLFRKKGSKDSILEGFMFALYRQLPGLTVVDRGVYRLPEDWKTAVETRTWRFRPPALDVFQCKRLKGVLDSAEGLDELREALDESLGELANGEA